MSGSSTRSMRLPVEKQGKNEAIVAWTNLCGPQKTRVFCTTIGHNNATVKDDRYLDLVARGCLWACEKIDASGTPLPGYGKPEK